MSRENSSLLSRAQKIFRTSGLVEIQERIHEWQQSLKTPELPESLTTPESGKRINMVHLLAPSYGALTSKAYIYADQSLESLVSEAIGELEKAQAENKPITWSVVNAAFRQAPGMQLDESRSKSEFKRWTLEKKHWSSGSKVDESIVNELTGWLNELIQDAEILGLDSTKVLPTELSTIVANCGVLRDCMNNRVSALSKDFLEIGILRFPDIDSPYIQVYRISLSAWATCDRKTSTFGRAKILNRSGVTGHYQANVFRPREHFISIISGVAYRLAVEDRELEERGERLIALSERLALKGLSV